jgi:hypothetical protein
VRSPKFSSLFTRETTAAQKDHGPLTTANHPHCGRMTRPRPAGDLRQLENRRTRPRTRHPAEQVGRFTRFPDEVLARAPRPGATQPNHQERTPPSCCRSRISPACPSARRPHATSAETRETSIRARRDLARGSARPLVPPLHQRPRTDFPPSAPCAPPSESALTPSAHKNQPPVGACVHRNSGESRTARRWLMADRRTAAPATAHGVARRFLVFKLPDQIALCFTESAGDVRVLSDRY